MRILLSGFLLLLLFSGCSQPPTLVRPGDFENDGSEALVRQLMNHDLLKELPTQPEVVTIILGKHPQTQSASVDFLKRFKDTGKIMAPKSDISFYSHTKEIYHRPTKETPVTIQLIKVAPSDISHYRITSGIAYKQNFIVEDYDVILTDDGPEIKRVNVLEQNWKSE